MKMAKSKKEITLYHLLRSQDKRMSLICSSYHHRLCYSYLLKFNKHLDTSSPVRDGSTALRLLDFNTKAT